VLTSRQRSGQRAEELAAAFLCQQGLTILLRNYRCRVGELDIVARERNVLVVAEVRTRADDDYGGAAASVDRRKQLRLTRAAARLLQQRTELARLAVRFDVLVVRDPEGAAPSVEWIKHAFVAP
jgi:putative endonuclease